jgi:hypothetical protein
MLPTVLSLAKEFSHTASFSINIVNFYHDLTKCYIHKFNNLALKAEAKPHQNIDLSKKTSSP